MNKHKVDLTLLPQPVLEEHPKWVELHDFAWQLAARSVRELRGRVYVCNAWNPARNFQWVWDTCFGSLFCRYSAGQLPGINGLDNFYDLQAKDGYISMTYDMDNGKEEFPNRINPPLFAWVEWEHYLVSGDASRLRRVIPVIEKHMDWIDANRRTKPHQRLAALERDDDRKDAGKYSLYYFRDAGSSGMDDSPRCPRVPEAGQFLDWIDLSSQMALSCACLARMNTQTGNAARAASWKKRAAELGKLVNAELWCEQTRFYHDRSIPTNFVAHKTVAGFWPILAGICTGKRLESLLEHLHNEREFNRPTPVPSLSADDLNYSPAGRYWCGGVWAPTNYMITRGLMNAGKGDAAHAIAMKYLGALARTWENHAPHTLWEAASPEEDLPGIRPYSRHPVKPDFVGWSALGPIAMLIENIIGLQINAPHNEITWDIRLSEGHGIKNLKIGNGIFRGYCAARKGASARAKVELASSIALTVRVKRGEAVKTVRLQPEAVAKVTV